MIIINPFIRSAFLNSLITTSMYPRPRAVKYVSTIHVHVLRYNGAMWTMGEV